jgi:hypothetical protein
MRKSCGEPKATGIRAIFLRQDEVFSRRMRDGERLPEKRGCHDFAENIPQICHGVVRFEASGTTIPLNFWHTS